MTRRSHRRGPVRNRAAAALCALLALGLATPTWAADPIGEAVAVKGDARAEGPDGSRTLGCGSPVYAGERIVTGENSLAGLLLPGGYVQVESGSMLDVRGNGDDATEVDLLRGRARAIAEGASPLALASRGARARLHGSDIEAYVLDEKAGPFAMFCDWAAPLAVSRDAESIEADPGRCVLAKPDEPLYAADAHDDRLPVLDLDRCDAPDVAAGPLSTRFAEPDVAAGLLVPAGFPDPTVPGGPFREPCDTPGSGCDFSTGSIPIVIDPPFDPGCNGAPGCVPDLPEPPVIDPPFDGGCNGAPGCVPDGDF